MHRLNFVYYFMKKYIIPAFLLLLGLSVYKDYLLSRVQGQERTDTLQVSGKIVKYKFSDNNCRSCHQNIEPIRSEDSEMMQEILEIAKKSGNPGNDCIVCHGGNPDTKNEKLAHQSTIPYFLNHKGPKNFYPDPGSPWINENTCGMCHNEKTKTQFTSLMFTEAGKIQGTLWGFGGQNGYNHNIGNYNVSELKIHEQLGSDTYKEYIRTLEKTEPQVFPENMKELPKAPTQKEIEQHPELAAITYLRQECQRCHLGNKGRSKRADFRGMGCSACHIPYSNEGFYEGKDPTIPKDERGHLLVHSLQGTRKNKVKIHENTYSGIPVETCTTCHNRGKRIGTSFQGIMETAYNGPFTDEGETQPKLHTKQYLKLHEDIHKTKGMLCQDCHTSLEVHSDGNLVGTTLAAIEIECTDCHGTPEKFPWELPIGYGDEYGRKLKNTARGLAKKLPHYLKKGTLYPPEDGYLLTARGNPLGNVVKKGNKILVHTAGGKDLVLKPLKLLTENRELSQEGNVAMKLIHKHIEKMECYACHSAWAPQCYGCHIKIDYSRKEKHPDWTAIGHAPNEQGLTPDALGKIKNYLIEGKIIETRSYLRWENPPLVVNGENRISPGVPGCQTTVTVINKEGKVILNRHIFKIPNVEGKGEEGQLAIDISPTQPHTTTKKARSCESCHSNPQAMGYGIKNGEIYANPSENYYVDLTDAEGNILSQKALVQMHAISNLITDWSRFVTEEGEQLQTIGHHLRLSRPLSTEERSKLDRRGVCLSCHQHIPEGDIAINLLSHLKNVAGKKVDTQMHSEILSKTIILSGWAQIVIGFLLLGIGVGLGYYFFKKK